MDITMRTRGQASLCYSLILIAGIIMVMLLSAAPASASDWTIETVDAPKYFGASSSRAIAIDSEGRPHVVYGMDHLYGASYDGIKWNYETIDTSSGVGLYASIALDSLGKAHISYYDALNDDLKYATNASGAWIISTIDSAGDVGQDSSIALDSTGKAHISYYDASNAGLKYATNASGAWVTSTIDSAGYGYSVGRYTSIALDSSGNVHISYYNENNQDLKYATNASGAWVTSTIDSAGYVGQYTSIALDSTGKVHISYYDYTNKDLKYATNASGAWVISTVESAGNVGSNTSSADTSIALDAAGKVHISYLFQTNFLTDDLGELKYVTNASGAWVTYTFSSATARVGGVLCTSIALDSAGKGHIIYNNNFWDVDIIKDRHRGDLQYATNTSGVWVGTTIDSVGWVGEYSSLALDSAGKVHISYYDWGLKALAYSTNSSGAWVTSIRMRSPETDGMGEYSSLALDPAGKVHISYYDWDRHITSYVTNASGLWASTPIDWNGGGGSLALDSTGKAHISYGVGSLPYATKYATNASGAWVISVIDNESNRQMNGYTSIALDATGKVHISYPIISIDSGKGFLKYATNASGAWVTSTIDSGGDIGQYWYTSIALDSSGKVHISYYDTLNRDLKYATNASGAWVTSTIDSGGYVGQYTSIALDSSGNVHISYYDETNADLKYATNASGAWVTSTIDSAGYVGQYTSIAPDSSGNVHISYYDVINGDLKYATNAVLSCTDADGDGYFKEGGACGPFDCNDNDPAIHPGAVEVCDGVDNNCNGQTDEGLAIIYYRDADGDMYGASANSLLACTQPAGYVTDKTDCNDGNASIHPGAVEVCDGGDNNCNGVTDEGFDADGDGYTICGGDCNDANPLERPGQTWYADGDGDGYSSGVVLVQCLRPTGYKTALELTAAAGDCNDANSAVNPAALEVCNNMDDNCSGAIDEGGICKPPIAIMGLSVHIGSPVALDAGESTDPDSNLPLAYAWNMPAKPAGSAAVLSDPGSVNPSFIPDVHGSYQVQLVVTDSMGLASAPALVFIRTSNSPPVAEAGPDQSVSLIGTTVRLNGGQSYDLDGDTLTYLWTFVAKPAGSSAVLTGADTAAPTFIADAHGTYIAKLLVSDPWASSTPDTVTVSFDNVKPAANAGTSTSVIVGQTVGLNGSGSADANGDPLAYRWSFTATPAGSAAVIAAPTAMATSFVPDLPGIYAVQLVVNDGTVDSDPSAIQVLVVTAQSAAVEAVRSLQAAIALLSDAAFKNANMRNALINKLNAAIANIETGNYASVLGQLRNDVLGKTDGCATAGSADKDDWITNCGDQGTVHSLVLEAVRLVQSML